MAQTALSGSDLSKIRGRQSIPDLQLYLTPLVQVASATIVSTPAKYPTVQATVSWIGGSTDVLVGQYYRIYDGTTIISHGIIRKPVSGSTVYITETPLGSHGFAANIESAILPDMSIVIYSHHAMFSLNSRIANKTFYKYWDVAYSNQNETTAPIANAGAWQAYRLQAGESTARFTLPRSGENSSFQLGLENYLGDFEWILPTGVTLADGYAVDDAVIEVDAVAGNHLIQLSAFHGGNEHSAYLWLFVSDGSTGTGLQESFAIRIDGDSQTLLGREMSFTVTGSNLQNTLYDGAGVLFKCISSYAGDSLSSGTEIDSFIGYIKDLRLNHDGNIGKATFKAVSPLLLAQEVGQPSQSLTQVVNPANWNQMNAGNGNVRFFIYYLMKWTCPALMDMHDLDIPYDYEETFRKYLETNGKAMGSNFETVANYMLSNFGSASDGTSVMRRKPQYLSNDDRNALAVIWTILDTDIKAPLEYFKRIYAPVSDVRGGAFMATANTKPKASYAGRRWGQGSGTAELSGFIVKPPEGETRIKEVLGHFMAEQNAEIQEIGIDLTMNQDVIDPAYLAWFRLTVSAEFDPLGIGFTNQRLFATEIERQWEFDETGIKKRIRLIGQVETFGQAGEILPIGNANGASLNGYSVGFPNPFAPGASGGMFGGSAQLVLALNTLGEGAISFDYSNPNPTWESLNNGVGGEVINDWDFDWGSSYFSNGGDSREALGLFVLTISGTTASIWYFTDILRSYDASVIQQYTITDSSIDTEARLACSETYPDLVIAVFKDGSGTRYGRSSNGGTTWGSLTRAGSAISDIADNDNREIGLALFGQRQFLTAPDSSADYGVYAATSAGGAFSILGSSELSRQPIPMIVQSIEDKDCIFVTQLEGGRYSNDFDGSDYFDFYGTGGITDPGWRFSTGAGSNWASDGVVSGGVGGGDCHKFSATTISGNIASRSLFLIFGFSNLGSPKVINASFDVKFSSADSEQTLHIRNLVSSGDDVSPLVGQGVWHHVNCEDDVADWTGDDTDFQPQFYIGNELDDGEIYFDNIVLFLGVGYNLWRVDDVTGSPTWTAIDPAANRAPARPFGLAVNMLDPDILHFASQFGGYWYKSSDNGDNFTTMGTGTAKRTFFASGENLLAGGAGTIEISYDGGTSFNDISGNLDNLWNGIGTIKKLMAL